ncbi:hypothetical protein BCR33DRAFT_724278 [Rhizoclosmatium globosum]|uniref:Uncharacterized protein n=1 Tax=Rhizoclosmatium globosum TaxID=329046 RepID=A0A1Y2B8M2_9FUNG|nr:hypothetical protein BCR33DRAFT_724278 [Rhizoclosmatium globosum]|eukprot:ORY30445.1 hypothetical protein BCR33DRAFT_724278 [Rhizoclosmatium globosum]
MPCVAFAEVSTLFLALGTINSKWRNDLGFGISFLIGRILFHACVVVYAFQTYKNNYWIAPALPFPLHVHWFYKWTLGYLYPKKKIE